ncbi:MULTISPECIES: hypothetical protein [unclassified Bradyrhizobium]|uniref:hypothetical protein n=1 Tax=unclassified Bradyrhizobium TaxID=2631580 RepID=UPI002FF3D663
MKRRYSIFGREYGSDRDVELAQCDNNPQAVMDGLMRKTLTIKHSVLETSKKQSRVRKYTWLRIVENS